MSSYPKSMSYYLTRLNQFSRQKYRVQTLANTTFNPSDLTVLQLPEGLLDLSTFTLQGLLRQVSRAVLSHRQCALS